MKVDFNIIESPGLLPVLPQSLGKKSKKKKCCKKYKKKKPCKNCPKYSKGN